MSQGLLIQNKRKIFKINITDKGKEAYNEVLPTVAEHWQSTIEDVSDEELENCLTVLKQNKGKLRKKLNIQI